MPRSAIRGGSSGDTKCHRDGGVKIIYDSDYDYHIIDYHNHDIIVIMDIYNSDYAIDRIL